MVERAAAGAAAGIWVRRNDRLKHVHQPRARRDCLGELVQIDGSEHWWFEDRGPQCTLLVYIDDATSRLMHLKFVEPESTFDYFQATREYLEAHGKPVAFYSDKHGVFRVNSAGAVQSDGMTQFGRSLHALNIDILCANTPQAKGRVERANKTLQDRLVKELRLQEISTIAAGNELLPGFLADYTTRFGKEPHNPKNLHRPLSAGDDLTDIFAWREERTVSNSLTLQYDRSGTARTREPFESHSSWNMRTSAIGTEDTHGRSTPRDQPFSHGLGHFCHHFLPRRAPLLSS
jgi:hypothetical protein